MSFRVRLAEIALADLDAIWDFIAADDPSAADRFVDLLVEKAFSLGDMPEMGRSRDEIESGIRSFPVRRYVLFYKVFEEELVVLRIVSGHRDLDALFP